MYEKMLIVLTYHYNCTLVHQTYTQDTYYMDAVIDISFADLLDSIPGYCCSLPSSVINSKLICLKKKVLIHKHLGMIYSVYGILVYIIIKSKT